MVTVRNINSLVVNDGERLVFTDRCRECSARVCTSYIFSSFYLISNKLALIIQAHYKIISTWIS